MKTNFKRGDRVIWTYKHNLNSKSFTYITKIGTIIELSGKIKNIRYVSGSVAIVMFDGNKTNSRVPIEELAIDKTKQDGK